MYTQFFDYLREQSIENSKDSYIYKSLPCLNRQITYFIKQIQIKGLIIREMTKRWVARGKERKEESEKYGNYIINSQNTPLKQWKEGIIGLNKMQAREVCPIGCK